MSRNGKPYLACPHLYQDKVTLDGELYSHDYKDDFNKIVSLCKKQKPTDDELAESAEKVQFWAYDWPDEDVFSKRYKALKTWVESQPNKSIKLVPTYRVETQAQIDFYHDQFLSEGYEGSILRLDLGGYEYKRSKQLLKKKDFIDEEFEIVGAEEGEGGRAGTIGYFFIDVNGKVCKTNVKGDFEYLKDVWKNKEQYIGTMATVKYFNKTPDGALRFPYVIKLNRAEYE
jgi:DNA ligase-1